MIVVVGHTRSAAELRHSIASTECYCHPSLAVLLTARPCECLFHVGIVWATAFQIWWWFEWLGAAISVWISSCIVEGVCFGVEFVCLCGVSLIGMKLFGGFFEIVWWNCKVMVFRKLDWKFCSDIWVFWVCIAIEGWSSVSAGSFQLEASFCAGMWMFKIEGGITWKESLHWVNSCSAYCGLE